MAEETYDVGSRGQSAAEVSEVNARIDASIAIAAASTNVAAELLAQGCRVVALDVQGRTVEFRPDGTSSIVA